MNRRSITLLIVGAITFVVTAIVLALCISDWSGNTPLAAVLIAWAEIVLFGGLILVEKVAKRTEQMILRASYAVLLPLYAGITIALSLTFMVGFKDARTMFITLQLIAFAIAAILLIVFYSVSSGVGASRQKTMDAITKISALVSRLNILAGSDNLSIFQKLSDDLRFSDTSVLVPSDDNIDATISEIELEYAKEEADRSAERIHQLCTDLNLFIAKRKLEVSSMKKGSI